MSNLVFEPKWNASINQVEAGEEIRGGKDGTANIATKQLAENIFYLKDNIYSLVGYVPPDLTDEVAELVQNTKDKFDNVINQIVIQNDAILAESRDRIAEVTATNAALAKERDERIAKYDAINAELSAESAARIQAILDEQLQRSEEILESAIAQEALLAAESKVIQDKLIADALELNNTITALGSRVDLDLAGLTTTITQTATDASTASEANANILNALKLEYEGNKASVLQKYTALATETTAQSELLVNLRASVDGAQSELTDFKSATATKDLATATEISGISSKVDANEAAFNTQITTIADDTSANTTQLTTLSSKMDTVEGQTADLIVKNTAVTTLTESTAEALTSLQSAYGLSTASFNESITTVTNDTQALTTKVNNLESATDDSLAAIRLKQEALTTEDEALATSISTLTTTFEGQTAQFTDQLSTLAADNLAATQKTETLRAQLVGGYDGSDLDQVSEGLLHQEKLARVNDNESLVQQIGLLAAGVGEQFDPKEIWHFSSEPEGWVGGVFEQGHLRVTNETVISPAFSLSGTAYRYAKMRVVRTGTPTWEGKLTYNNTLDVPGEVIIPEPIFANNIATIDIDTKWAGNITDIQLKLASTGDELNYILIDWIAIGRPSPGASSAALLDLKTSSARRDEALTQSISQLNAALNTKTAALESTINTKTETLTTAQQTQATNLVTLESKIDNIDSTLSSSISRNDETITTKHDALAATVTTLKSDTDTASALVTSQLETLTTADSALGLRIDSLSTSLDDTKAEIIATNKTFVDEDAALALSIGALTTTLDDNTAAINSQLESLVTQDASLATDLSSLSVRFGEAEDAIAQNSVDVLAETTARADAISAQAAKTDTLEAKVDGNNASITLRVDAEVTKTDATAESLTVLRSEFDTNSATYIDNFKSITDAAAAEAVKLDAVRTEFGTNKSTVASEILTINNAAESLSQQVTQLSSNFNANTADYTTKFKALTDEDISLGDAITDLSASFTVTDGIVRQNTTDIKEESRVRADAISAEASRITALTTKVDGNIAEVNTKTDALTTSTEANASQLTTIAGEVAGNKATIKSNNDVQVALNAVTANKLDYVSAEIEGGYSDKTHYALKNKSVQWTRTTSIAEALFNTNEKVNNLNSEFGQNIATFSESIKTLANENMALSERTTEFAANYKSDKVQNTANITSINQAIATNNSAITSFDTRLTVEYIPKVDNLEANINNIEIGGRNLLINTGYKSSPEAYSSTVTIIDGYPNEALVESNGDDKVGIITDRKTKVEAQTEYTLSFELRTNTITSLNYNYLMDNDESNSSIVPSVNNIIADGEWHRYVTTFNSYGAGRTDCGLMLATRVLGTNDSFYIRKLKLERGNKATDWTPAPEDIDVAIQGSIDIGNNITREFGELKAETKVLTDIDGKISGWKNLNNGTTSSFDILADKFSIGNAGVTKKPFSIVGNDVTFNGKVSFNSMTDTEEIDKAVNDINNLEIGSRNLVLGTYNFNGWVTSHGNSTITTSKVTSTLNRIELTNDVMKIRFNNTSQSGAMSPLSQGLIKDKTYSTKVFIRGNVNSYIVALKDTTGALTTLLSSATGLPLGSVIWNEISVIAPIEDEKIYTHFVIAGQGSAGQYIEVMGNSLKFEIGNKYTGWSPAPEDVQNEIAKSLTDAKTYADGLDEAVKGAFKDGIIEQAEAAAIKTHIARLTAEAQENIQKYVTITENVSHLGPAKTNLDSAFNVYFIEAESLVSNITSAVSTGAVTAAQRAEIDTRFEAYREALQRLTQRFEEAGASIIAKSEANANAYTDSIEIGGRNLVLGTYDFNGWVTSHGNSTVTTAKVTSTLNRIELTNDVMKIRFNNTSPSGAMSPLSQGLIKDKTYSTKVFIRGNANSYNIALKDTTGTLTTLLSSANGLNLVVNDWIEITVSEPIKDEKIYTHFVIAGQGAVGQYIEVMGSSLKFELGNKYTGWVPAPEDVQAVIDSKPVKIDVLYYLSGSATSLTGGTWQTTAPTWVNGKYMWSKTVTYDASDSVVSESKAVNISGAKGDTGTAGANGANGAKGADGAVGQGVESIVEQYAISSSKTSAPTSWLVNPPEWTPGKYLWTRSVITYKNPKEVVPTTPVCDTSWEAVNELEVGGRNLILKGSGVTYGYVNTSTNVVRYLTDLSSNQDFMTDYIPVKVGDNYVATVYPLVSNPTINTGIYVHRFTSGKSRIDHVYKDAGTGVKNVLNYTAISDGYIIVVFKGYTQYNHKLEKGNKSTDWTPAPEDVDAAINNVKTSVTDITSDGKITPNEKRELLRVKDEIVSTHTELLKSVTTVPGATTPSTYTTAYSNVTTRLTNAAASPTTITNIPAADRTNLTNALSTYFTERAKLNDLVVTKSKAYTESQANAAKSAAATDATTKANNAKTAAQTAAATDATTKANKALADAKTDATTKANNAKTAAQTYADLNDKIVVIDSKTKKFLNPSSYSSAASAHTGYLIIETPIQASRMVTIDITGYNYQANKASLALTVSFYITGTNFVNFDYADTGTYPIENVRLGLKGGKVAIIIGNAGSTWAYPKIDVTQAIIGHSNPPDTYKDGWATRISSSIADITDIKAMNNIYSTSLKGIQNNVYYPNTTEIDGGNIRTKTIAADSIKANSITAGQLATNSVTANEINVANLASISANIGNITAGSIKGVNLEIGVAAEAQPGCEYGSILRASPSGFQLLSRDDTGGIELSSATRALTVWQGDKIRVIVGKIS